MFLAVTGFDINTTRVGVFGDGWDPKGEVSDEDLKASALLVTSGDRDHLYRIE